MKKMVTVLLFAVVSLVVRADESRPETDGEIWNRGVDEYRKGDTTNALAVLRPLILSKTHGARAAELAGALSFAEAAKTMDDPEKRLRMLENAASDFQLSLRADPADQRKGRNFTRAIDRLPELRETAHIAAVLKELGNQDPGALLGSGVKDVRKMTGEFSAALTNVPQVTVSKCEALGKRMEKLSDVWIVVKSGVQQSVTNEQQAMTISAQVEEARKATDEAAVALSDIDPIALDNLMKAEASLNRFWKLAILPPAACDEAILCQTNELIAAETVNGRIWQNESLDFVRVFRAKFPAWAQAYEQQAQSDTNKPPFTKAAQDEISTLALAVEKEQIAITEGLKSAAREREVKGGGKSADRALMQLEVLKKLNRIRELLPKDGGGGGQNQNQNQQQNQQQNQNKDKNDKKENQDQNAGADNQDKRNDERQDDKKDEEKDDKQSPEQEKDERQVEDMIRKAQERNDEHEAEKKARMRNAPLPPNERDW